MFAILQRVLIKPWIVCDWACDSFQDGSSGDEWVEMGQSKSDTTVPSCLLDSKESMSTSATKSDSNITEVDQNTESVSTKVT